MGRFSRPLAAEFAAFAAIGPDAHVLDVGAGTGALTSELARSWRVVAAEPSPPFADALRATNPATEVHVAPAEALPFADGAFDAALAQLVVHFMDDPAKGASEMARITRPGGIVAACTWDFAGGGMKLLATFWQSVRALDPDAELETSPMGDRGRLDALWRGSGFQGVETEALEVSSDYEDFDELWSSFSRGVGPAGQYLLSQPPERQEAIRAEYFARVGEPPGRFTLTGRSWAVRGRVPE